ncbi:asialoglycoprotein receptor 1-like [Archocentrus centrarchus]|uniref:asialoglycoprotein receptor 1-like n=1 Tax=Archocentrus centrarchus TaxID=63155 RepID=UPI0011E9BB1F|nr:asialoglycoprotein receptor 1-like [Archocentrus centrarchus]
MNEQMLMADYRYVKEGESALCIKETPPTPRSPASRFRRWLFPALTGVILLISIILLGTTYMKMSNHLQSLEQRLSNQSDIQSLETSVQQAQETAKEVKQLQFAVESNKNQLTSVLGALKQLEVIDSLSRSVATIKCSLKRIINNSSSTEGCCPPDWTAFEFSCYYFSRGSLSWNDSRDWCETQQAHLVILRADKEWDFVIHRTAPQQFWIGLSDWRTGRWEWVDQTPYTVESKWWDPGQPDNWADHGLGPGTEDCAHINYDGLLNDQYCSIKKSFICQKNYLGA